MGFSIGRFLGSVAPAIGSVIAGPLGATLGFGISAALGGSERSPVPARAVTSQRAPQFASRQTSIVPSPVRSFGVFPRQALPAPQPVRGQARRAGTVLDLGMDLLGFAGGDQISQILAQARETFGRGVTKNKIIAAAKACGIETAADTFGLSESQVCKVIVAGRTRRRRGISAADIRRTKRTLRTIGTIRKDLRSIKT